MYPTDDLSALAARKTLLCVRTAARRQQCVMAAGTVFAPLGNVDAIAGRWRKTPTWLKVVGIPVALWLGRTVVKRMGGFSKLARLAPLVWRTAQAVTARR